MVWIRDQVEILGATYEPMSADGYPTDNDEANVVIVQGFEQSAKVEFGQRAAAAPLMALICLQSACTRASRVLIGARRSASSRRLRASASSLMLPVSSLPAMAQV